jgi:hypothetical protein
MPGGLIRAGLAELEKSGDDDIVSNSTYYVYLLRDPRNDDRRTNIFYVGKGKNLRASQHELYAARLRLMAAPKSDEVRRKLAILDELADEGRAPEIDMVATSNFEGLKSDEAFLVEAALIATLEMTELGNEVLGHRIRLIPDSAYRVAALSKGVVLPGEPLFVGVPVSGIWGGANLLGNLLGGGDSEVWGNAEKNWSRIAPRRVDKIAAQANTDQPVILLALDSNPTDGKKCIVVGVFQLRSAQLSGLKKGGYADAKGHYVEEHDGWSFARVPNEHEAPIVASLRAELLGHSPIDAIKGPIRKPQDRSYFNW